MKKTSALLPLLVFAVLVALFAAPLLRGTDPSLVPSAMIGKPAPLFSLAAAVEGGAGFSDRDLKNAKGPSLVNVFASWCVTCGEEHEVLSRFVRDENIALYGIDYKDAAPAIADWLKKRGNPYKAIGLDAEGRAALDWGVYGVPETYVVDKTGVIRYRFVGPLTAEDCQRTLKPLLAELSK